MKRIWCFIFILFVATVEGRDADSPQCPSTKCACITQEVASRQEVKILCNSDQHQGYVPVFRQFTEQISSLTLSRAQLVSLGNNTFRSLRSVRELYLNDNYLSTIEARAFAHIDSGLELLDLQHNRISDVSFVTTHDFGRLRELLLRDNRIAEIRPDTFALTPVLDNLNLDDNRLGSGLAFLRQPSLGGLSYLNVDANRISEINPDDFEYLRHLKSLLVNRNRLENLDFLLSPHFKQLQGISAAGNRISQAGENLFSNKRRMKWIDLSSNGLTEANFTASCALASLREIHLGHNRITSLPETAFRATDSLAILVVKGNRLTTLPRCALARFYGRMDTFDISHNPLECGCQLAWLSGPRDIVTERQSQCGNIEFTDTASFGVANCRPPEPCVTMDKCTAGAAAAGVRYDIGASRQLTAHLTSPSAPSSAGGLASHRQPITAALFGALLPTLYYSHWLT